MRQHRALGAGRGGERPGGVAVSVVATSGRNVPAVSSKDVVDIGGDMIGPGQMGAEPRAWVEAAGVGLLGPVVGRAEETARVDRGVVVEEDRAAEYAVGGGEVRGAVGAESLFAHFGSYCGRWKMGGWVANSCVVE